MNTLRTTILLAILTALLLVAGQALGGQVGMIIAFGLAIIMNFGSYWFSDSLVLSIYQAQEVGPDEEPKLYQIVQDLAQKAGLPMPRVYVIHSDAPNAFATGRDPNHAAVAATTGLMQILSHNELTGVMAHELAHVQNRDTLIGTVAATIAGAIAMLANMAQWAMILGMGHQDDEKEGSGGFIGALVMMIVAPIAASLIQMAISRAREYAADARGASICGNPLFLANALYKLETGNQDTYMPEAESHPATTHMLIINPLKGASLANLFSTHPATEERIRRLQAMQI
ncbi:protease HtpX [Achromatium sp. WMS3]|nr:protease HtpX [Achromatium sp. WMS3]